MPTPMAMPPRLIRFMVRSKTFIRMNTARMQTGMEMAMVTVGPQRRRNSSTTMAARITPRKMFCSVAVTTMLI